MGLAFYFFFCSVPEREPCNTILNDTVPGSLASLPGSFIAGDARACRHQPIPSTLDQNVSQMGVLRDPAVSQEGRLRPLLRDSEQFCWSVTAVLRHKLCAGPQGSCFSPWTQRQVPKGLLGTQ